MAPEWISNTSIYEVNLRQYTAEGTIKAFMPHLPRLKQMGIDTLWFMPITPISEKNRKGTLGSYYACSDYTSISKEFGSEEEFKQLVTTAHSLGMKVIIDWVANHTGWDHRWTYEHPAYYKRDNETGDFKMASGMEDIIELDFDNNEMEQAMIAAMQWWVKEFNIDGFRCDLAFWVPLDFWKKARPELDALKPLFWLGEFDEMERPEYGEAFDASYSWKWMHKTEEYYKKGLPLKELVQLLKHYDDLGPNCLRTWFTSNHDENSWNGTEYEKYGPMCKPLAVFSITWDGIPLIYSGQELPLQKRLAFFDRDTIEWEENLQLDNFYGELLHLKKTHPALRAGDRRVRTLIVKTDAADKVFTYLRTNDVDRLLVLLNLSPEPITLRISDDRIDAGLSPGPYQLEGWGYLLVQ